MTDPTVKEFNPGGIKDRVDTRDFQWKEIAFSSPPFDWNVGVDIEATVGKLPVKDQGPSFSCGGQAWANYACALEAVLSGSIEERSAKFIYAQTYQAGGGSTGRDNAEIYVKQGTARETTLTSYQNGNTPSETFMERGGDITTFIRQDARSDISLAYAQVEPANIDKIAQAIRDSSGIVLGIDGQNNGSWLSAFPVAPTKVEWRHWIYAGKAKIVNGKKYIGAFNSWGAHVGEGGWQWLGEEYFKNGHVWSGWTHVINPNPVPSSFHHRFSSNIVYGQSGAEVLALQTALQVSGEFPKTVPVSGFYGGITANAVLAFRLKYGVSSATDLIGHSVGTLTRARLNALFS